MAHLGASHPQRGVRPDDVCATTGSKVEVVGKEVDAVTNPESPVTFLKIKVQLPKGEVEGYVKAKYVQVHEPEPEPEGAESEGEGEGEGEEELEEGEYVVSAILDHREKGGKREYSVLWEGYAEPTWEPPCCLTLHGKKNEQLLAYLEGLRRDRKAASGVAGS